MLKLEHINNYLPWKLRVKYFDHQEGFISKVDLFQTGTSNPIEVSYTHEEFRFPRYIYLDYDHITPLVRPLSQLVDEITVPGYNDGKPFVPISQLHYMACRKALVKPFEYELKKFKSVITTKTEPYSTVVGVDIDLNRIEQCKSWVVDILYRWQFDVKRLIEKGLAEPVNR